MEQYDHDAQVWLNWIEQFRVLRLIIATSRALPPASELGFDP